MCGCQSRKLTPWGAKKSRPSVRTKILHKTKETLRPSRFEFTNNTVSTSVQQSAGALRAPPGWCSRVGGAHGSRKVGVPPSSFDGTASCCPIAVMRGSHPHSHPHSTPRSCCRCRHAQRSTSASSTTSAQRDTAPSHGSIPPSALTRPRDNKSFRRGRRTNTFYIAASYSVATAPSVAIATMFSLVTLTGSVRCDFGHVRGAEPEA